MNAKLNDVERDILAVFEAAGLSPIERGLHELRELQHPSRASARVIFRTVVTNGTEPMGGADAKLEPSTL